LLGRDPRFEQRAADLERHAGTVVDDGPGVPLEVRSTLFEPGVTTKQGGWGIGLALARRIVEDVHGGRLALQQTAAGATFVATLPLESS
ncbi:MAG: two-component sensor histidine kinase, partial [Gemmatimonadetes bacterium]|nr:two-component sensor histidine kinase [Gemmatimonadota bacterium]